MSNFFQILGDLSGLENLFSFLILLFIIGSVLAIASIVIFFIVIFSICQIFEKANKEPWKAIIPFYNFYTLCQITGVSYYWLIVITGLYFLYSCTPNLYIAILLYLTLIYYYILISVSVAKSFGKEKGFTIGLMLFPYIFYPILARSSSTYLGPNPMRDIFFCSLNHKDTNPKENGQTSSVTNNQGAFCANCGYRLESTDNFCLMCGTKRN